MRVPNVPIVLLSAALFHNTALADEPVDVVKVWAEIQSAGANRPVPRDEQAVERHWRTVTAQAQQAFQRLQNEQDEKSMAANAEFYVEQFGLHGPQADLRWILASPQRLFPQPRDPNPELRIGSVSDPGAETRGLDLQTPINEALVLALLKRPKMRDRYYRALLWSMQFLGGGSSQGVRLSEQSLLMSDVFDQPTTQRVYWDAALKFVVFAHATSRDDLLKDADPTKLGEQFKEWWPWFLANQAYFKTTKDGLRWMREADQENNEGPIREFRPNEVTVNLAVFKFPPGLRLPKQPFEDWKGAPPPDPRHVFKYAIRNYTQDVKSQ